MNHFKHEQLYYAENITLPLSVLEVLPLLKLSGRPGSQKVQRLFGVAPLDERSVKINIAAVESSKFASAFEAEIEQIKPFMYAHRMHSNLDPILLDRLKNLTIKLCRTINGIATVEQQDVQIALHSFGDRVVSGDTVYLVEDIEQRSGLTENRLLADVIGEIVAAVLKVRMGSDFALLVSCPQQQRMRLLAQMLKSEPEAAEQFVREAREKLFLPDSEGREVGSKYVAPPVNTTSHKDSSEQEKQFASSYTSEQNEGTKIPSTRTVPETVSAERLKQTDLLPRRSIALRVSTTPTLTGVAVSYQSVTDPALCESISARFEEAQGQARFPLMVEHKHGFEWFGCDILSFKSYDDRKLFEVSSDARLVTRFIEVKDGMAQIELKGNELAAARRHRERYYLYHVQQGNDDKFTVTTLANPAEVEYDEVRVIDMTRAIEREIWQVSPIQEPLRMGSEKFVTGER